MSLDFLSTKRITMFEEKLSQIYTYFACVCVCVHHVSIRNVEKMRFWTQDEFWDFSLSVRCSSQVKTQSFLYPAVVFFLALLYHHPPNLLSLKRYCSADIMIYYWSNFCHIHKSPFLLHTFWLKGGINFIHALSLSLLHLGRKYTHKTPKVTSCSWPLCTIIMSTSSLV